MPGAAVQQRQRRGRQLRRAALAPRSAHKLRARCAALAPHTAHTLRARRASVNTRPGPPIPNERRRCCFPLECAPENALPLPTCHCLMPFLRNPASAPRSQYCNKPTCRGLIFNMRPSSLPLFLPRQFSPVEYEVFAHPPLLPPPRSRPHVARRAHGPLPTHAPPFVHAAACAALPACPSFSKACIPPCCTLSFMPFCPLHVAALAPPLRHSEPASKTCYSCCCSCPA